MALTKEDSALVKTPGWVRQFIDGSTWTFAKTYAAFCPHEYVVRRRCENPRTFDSFGQFVMDNGFWCRFGKGDPGLYWIDPDGDYYYWVLPGQMDGERFIGESIINRARRDLWEIYKYEDLLGAEWRVRYKTKAEREAQKK